jgi:hypothetical protein
MATFEVIIPDDKVVRIREAFGHDEFVTNTHVPATLAEVKAAIRGFLRERVDNYETTRNAIADRAARNSEVWT